MLAKRARHVFVPGSPGQQFRPAYTSCVAGATPGRWETNCTERCYPAGTDPYSGGTYSHCFNECVSRFIPTGPPAPPVCTNYPAIPFIAAVAPSTRIEVIRAWDAGANSIDVIDGNARFEFAAQRVVGVIAGFAVGRGAPSVDRVTHGAYMHQSAGGVPLIQPVESGVAVGPAQTYATGVEVEIRREGGRVKMLLGGVETHQFRTPSVGPVVAAAVMYQSGDQI